MGKSLFEGTENPIFPIKQTDTVASPPSLPLRDLIKWMLYTWLEENSYKICFSVGEPVHWFLFAFVAVTFPAVLVTSELGHRPPV